jgi:hypothetical protein
MRAVQDSEDKRSCRRAEFRSEQRKPKGDCSVCLHKRSENEAQPERMARGE